MNFYSFTTPEYSESTRSSEISIWTFSSYSRWFLTFLMLGLNLTINTGYTSYSSANSIFDTAYDPFYVEDVNAEGDGYVVSYIRDTWLDLDPTPLFQKSSYPEVEEQNNITELTASHMAAMAMEMGTSGVSGNVYDDADFDGIDDGVGETGVAGVEVYIYDCSGNQVATDTTDANGDYLFNTTANGGLLTTGAQYRVEFVLPAGLSAYTSTISGTNNGTTIQFVTEPACADLGITIPVVCNPNTLAQNGKVLITCSVFNGPTDVMALYDVAGLTMATSSYSPSAFTHPDWSIDWIGNVYFTEFDKDGNIYAAASLKHANGFLDRAQWQYGFLGGFVNGVFGDINDLGAAGTLYKMDAITGEPSVWLQLPQQAADYDGRTTGPGVGGVAYIRETDQIAVANMEDGKIYLFDASATGSGPFGILNETHAVDIFDPYDPDPGTIGMGAYSERIQGIDYYNGRLYYVSSDANLLLVGSVALNNGMFDDATERAEISRTKEDTREVPLDIDFSTDGKMAVGTATGGGISTNTYYDNNVPVLLYNHFAGNYVFEYSGSSWQLMATTRVGQEYGTINNGTATGGVAWNDKVGATGSVNNILWMSGGDFIGANSSWGVLGNEYTAGSFVESPFIQWVFPNQFTIDFKGNGGDVDVFSCIPTPTTIQIGNYIWSDTDNDGIQDACEPAISGVMVELVKDGSVLATTMTDSNGEYYFSDADGLEADSSYVVRVSNAIGGSQQAALSGLEVTISNATDPNSANDDLIDSDIVMNGNDAEITVTIGSVASVNHSLDFGFFSACNNPVLSGLINETICTGATFDTTNVTTSVTNGVPITYQWYDNNGTDNPGTSMIAGQTDSVLTVLPSAIGSYSYRVVASSTVESNCTAEQTVDLVIGATPTATADITDATCTGSTANNDGTITIAGFNTGERYDFTTGSSYSGSATFASGSTEIPVGGVILNTLTNATQQYTVRIFNSSECFVDRTVTINEVNCLPTCTGSSGVAGYVFTDDDFDGENAGEMGVEGILVYIYDCDGNIVDSTSTNGGGNYTFNTTGNGGALTAGAQYRVEFVLPAAFSDYSPTVAGTNNGTTVQFVTEPACAYLGISGASCVPDNSNLIKYGQVLATCAPGGTTSPYVMGIFETENLTYSTATQNPTVFHHTDWTYTQMGNILFTELDTAGQIYAASSIITSSESFGFLWRYGDIGGGSFSTNAAGTLYRTDPITGAPSVWAVLPQLGDSYERDGLDDTPKFTGPGLTGVAYVESCNLIAVANLEDGKIYLFDAAASGPLTETDAISIYDPYTTDGGASGMPDHVDRIMGLDFYDGRLYFVSSYRNGLNAPTHRVSSVGISGCAISGGSFQQEFEFQNTAKDLAMDLDFSIDGKLAIGSIAQGRFNVDQGEVAAGYFDSSSGSTQTVPTLYNHRAGTFIFEKDGGGTWQRTHYSPVGQELWLGTEKNHTAQGGVAWNDKVGSTGQLCDLLWMGGGDFNNEDSEFGVIGYDYTTLGNDDSVLTETSSDYIQFVFDIQDPGVGDPTDYKGSGGDVDVFGFCSKNTAIEIGNYIWNDEDKDGIQDACEPAIANVTVELLKDGSVIATTMTDTKGEYYFSNADGLEADSTYTVRVSNAIGGSQQAALSGLEVTISNATDANSANDDLIDSDIVTNGNNAEITVTVGSAGSVNHSLDFGFSSSDCVATAPVIAGDQTICSGGDPVATTVTMAATGNGTLTYQWQESTVDCTTGFADIGSATADVYDPPALTQTSYYRVIVTNTIDTLVCSDTSNCVTMIINDVSAATIGSDQAVCSGDTPATLSSTVAASGDGTLTHQWQMSTTDCSSGFSDIGSATGTTYSPGALTSTTYYRLVTTSTLSGVACMDTSNCVTITVNDVTAAVIGTDQTICSGDTPATMTSITPATGEGTLTHQWQMSTTDCGNGFVDIGGATGTSYSPSALTTTTYYRQITTSAISGVFCRDTSNCITISVIDITAAVIGTDQTICSGDIPATITSTTPASGNGTLTHQWQVSTTSCAAGFADIGSATGTTYTPGALTTTSYYRLITTSTIGGESCLDTSNCVTITINEVVASTISSDQIICSGGDPSEITASVAASGSGTLSYQWQTSTTDCASGFADIGSAIGATYDPSVLSVTTYYRVIVSSLFNGVTCGDTSNCVTITVNDLTAAVIGSDQTICNGDTPATMTSITPAMGDGTLTHQWQMSTTDCMTGFGDIMSATSDSYTPGPISVTTYYRLVTTSTLGGIPCTAISNCVTITVNDVSASVIAMDQTICSGEDPVAFTVTTIASGDGTLTYQWQMSTTDCGSGFTDIALATSDTYDALSLTSTTYYRAIVTSTLSGQACADTSNCLTITVNPLPSDATTATDGVFCNGSPEPIISVDDPGAGLTISWWTAATGGSLVTGSTTGGNNEEEIQLSAASSPAAPGVGGSVTIYAQVDNDATGCVSSARLPVTLTNNPLPEITSITPFVCAGETTMLTASVTGGTPAYTYRWVATGITPFAGNDTSFLETPTFDATGIPATDYNLGLTVTDANGCQDTSTFVFTVQGGPDATFSVLDNTVCNGEMGVLYAVATQTAGTTYTWNVINGTPTSGGMSTDTFVVVDWDLGGAVGQVMIDITLPSGCVGSNQIDVTINPVITGSPTSDGPICAGDTLMLSANIMGGTAPINYSWTGPNGFTAVIENPKLPDASPGDAGYYIVEATDANGCGLTDSVNVTINALPVAVAGQDTTICTGESVQLDASGSTGTPMLSYAWSPSTGLNFDNIATPIASPDTTTAYTVTVTDGNGCMHADTLVVTVIPNVALGNLVFADLNEDGSFDIGIDSVFDGVTVELYPVDSVIGTHQPLLTDITSGGGFYLFDQIKPGQYTVHIPASEFTVGETLENQVSGAPQGGDTATDDDQDENGQNTLDNGGISSTIIDVQPDDEPTSEAGQGSYGGTLDDDNVNLTVDFTFIEEKVAVGNVVFMDMNDDGDYDSGIDMGLNGVIVQLYPVDSVVGVNQPLTIDTTANGGYYLFDQLPAGQYVVHIPASEFGAGEPLENKESAVSEGVDDTMDDDADENGQNTPVNGGVSSTPIDLQPNDEPSGESGMGTYAGTLDDDNVNLTVDFGFATEKVAIGNVVFMDTNEDGDYDLGVDMAIDGVVIELYPIDSVIGVNQPLLTTMTAGGGYYLFDQLTAGQYVVHIPASEFGVGEPLENKESAVSEGGDDALDDNTDENGQNTPVNGGISSTPIDLQPNDEPTSEGGMGVYSGTLDDDNVNLTVDFGFATEKVAIGNVVFMDMNDDGDYDLSTDIFIDGVVVELYPIDSVIGVNQPLLTTMTAGGGYYVFDQLTAGQYVVHIPSSEFGVGEPLENKESAASEGGDDTMDDNADENGQNTPVNGGISSATIDLQPNDEPTSEGGMGVYSGTLDDDNVNLTVDFGFATEKVAIGNVVFMDTNEDGDYDLGVDMAIDGVVIELYPIDSVIGVNQPLLTTMTAGGGYYLFDQLTVGQYIVHIPSSEFGVGEPLENKESAVSEGGDDALDDNTDENGQNTPVNGGISSTPIDLQPNDEPTSEGGMGVYSGTLDDDNVNLTVDFGFATEKVAIGNVVFMDMNDDGDYDLSTDIFIDGVVVELYPIDSVIGVNQPLLTTMTAGGGYYLFDQLTAGQYVVHIPSSEFGVGEPLENKESTVSEGVDDTMDDNADENGQNTPVNGGISSTPIDLQPNDEPTSEGGMGVYSGTLDDDNVNLTVDFGFATEKVAIGNVVFMDTNEDGDYDLGVDMAIDGVVVELYPIDSVIGVNEPLLTTMTAGGGYYLFDQLTAGQYVVHIPASEFGVGEPLENKESAVSEGGDDAMDDDADENGQNTLVNGGVSSTPIDLQPNDEPSGEGGMGTYGGTLDDDNVNLTVDFGFATEKVAIGNVVFMDTNDDGDYDLGVDMAIDGVVVELYPIDSVIGVNQPLLMTMTAGGGYYLFDELAPGQYVVHIPASEFGVGEPLENKESAVSEGVDDTMDDNADENGQNTPVNGGVSSTPIDLLPNDEPSGEGGMGTYSGTLDDDNVNLTVDFGFATEKVAIGNVVFMDANYDGDYDLGVDMAIDGVVVELYPIDSVIGVNQPLLTTMTAGGGYYLFDQLTAGQYVVHIPASEFGVGEPLENKESAVSEGGDDAMDDNADENGQNTPVNGGVSSTPIDLQPNDEPSGEGGMGIYTGTLDDDNVNLTVDFGFATEKVVIGNVVFMDTNDDGDYDLGVDMGINGVVVELYPIDSVIGVNQPLLTTMTAGGGYYFFDQLIAGQYVVHIPASEFGVGEPLENKESAVSEGGDDAMDDDADENGQNTPVNGGVSSTPIDLQPGDEPTGEGGAGVYAGTLDDDNVNLTVDFGFATEKVAIGNVVFMDTNDDGDYDLGVDMAIDGVVVELYPIDSVIGANQPLLTTMTAGGGYYLFDQLTAGQYVVHIPASEFGVGEPLENKESAVSEGGDDALDDNADENGQNTRVNGGVSSTLIDLQPNDEPSGEGGMGTYGGTLDDDNVNLTVDFGFAIEKVAIGNVVFMDTNDDGDYDLGVDMAIDGVVVELYPVDSVIGVNQPLLTTMTAGGGYYLFDELTVGQYVVHIPASEFGVGEPLENKESAVSEGGDDAMDDDADENGQNTPVNGGVSSTPIDLQPGDEPSGEGGMGTYGGTLDDDNVNLTVDFGFATEKVAIGNVVFMDTNDDGDYDLGVDMAIDGVVVELYPVDSVIGMNQPLLTTMTAGGGYYLFDQLTAGQYVVHIPASEFGAGEPLENKESAVSEGGDDTMDDNADENGQNTLVNGGVSSTPIDLQPNDEPSGEGGMGTYAGTLDDDNVNLTVDFGFATEKVAIGNVVFMDTNDDGDYDLGVDMAIDGVVVELYPIDSVIGVNQPLLTTMTAGGGYYLFDQLTAGQYVVHIPASEFGIGEPLENKESAVSEGVDDAMDDDADENGQNTPVNGGISSTPIDLQPNDEPSGEGGMGIYTGTLDDDNVNLTVDFGFATEKVAIGNVVFMDTNDDGDYDLGVDMAIDSVVVELYPIDSVIGVNQPLLTTMTAGGGYYLFDQLTAGQYVVHIPASEFAVDAVLDIKRSASPEGGDDAMDDDADENGQNILVSGGVSSTVIDLQPNDEPSGEGGMGTYGGTLDDDNVNLTVDFGFVTGYFDLALIKTVNENSPTPIFGGSIIFDLTVYNQGTDHAYDIQISDFVPEGLTLDDPAWAMVVDTARLINPVDSVVAGDSLTVSIQFIIDEGFSGGTLTNNAEIFFATDDRGSLINTQDNDSNPGDEDGTIPDIDDDDTMETNGDDDYDGEFICIVDFVCPANVTLPSCQSQADIDASYAQWMGDFIAAGCGHYGRFASMEDAPLVCGGSVTLTWQVLDSATMTVMSECTSTFTVAADMTGPICPTNWDLTVTVADNICLLPGYTDIQDLFDQTGITVVDNCTVVDLSYTDELVPAACSGGTFFPTREVVRSYTFTDVCGNESVLCPQVITYEFDECTVLTDFGVIEILGGTTLSVPGGCDAPLIEVAQEEQGVCGYVEYMWLVSTEEDADGNPLIPTNLNIGTIWTIIPDAVDPTYDPGVVTQNIYYVRCARNFGCCAFGESNIVSVLRDDTQSCPAPLAPVVHTDCDNVISLESPTHDFMNGEQMKYISDQAIQANNRLGAISRLVLESGQQVEFKAGFEVQPNARLEVHNNGCPE